jgi:hypothetical protein
MLVDIPFGERDRWLEVAPVGTATTIALMPPRAGEPTGIDTHVGFTTEDLDANHASLQARGVEVDGAVMCMGGPAPPMLFFRDLAGSRFLIVERG